MLTARSALAWRTDPDLGSSRDIPLIHASCGPRPSLVSALATYETCKDGRLHRYIGGDDCASCTLISHVFPYNSGAFVSDADRRWVNTQEPPRRQSATLRQTAPVSAAVVEWLMPQWCLQLTLQPVGICGPAVIGISAHPARGSRRCGVSNSKESRSSGCVGAQHQRLTPRY